MNRDARLRRSVSLEPDSPSRDTFTRQQNEDLKSLRKSVSAEDKTKSKEVSLRLSPAYDGPDKTVACHFCCLKV